MKMLVKSIAKRMLLRSGICDFRTLSNHKRKIISIWNAIS